MQFKIRHDVLQYWYWIKGEIHSIPFPSKNIVKLNTALCSDFSDSTNASAP